MNVASRKCAIPVCNVQLFLYLIVGPHGNQFRYFFVLPSFTVFWTQSDLNWTQRKITKRFVVESWRELLWVMELHALWWTLGWHWHLLLLLKGSWCQLYYPNREIILSWLKPYSPNEDTIDPNRETLGWHWHLLLLLKGSWCQLYYPNREIILSWLKPYSPNEDTIDPNRETLGWHWHLLLLLKGSWCQLYYPDREILLSWLKPYSPNEDTNRP